MFRVGFRVFRVGVPGVPGGFRVFRVGFRLLQTPGFVFKFTRSVLIQIIR